MAYSRREQEEEVKGAQLMNNLHSDISDIACYAREVSSIAVMVRDYAINAELTNPEEMDKVIIALGVLVPMCEKLEQHIDDLEKAAYTGGKERCINQ